MKFFFPGVSEETSYNAGITWSPDEYRFVFMSNGGEGNYDLYLQDLGAAAPKRLTDHKEKDGQAHWSPFRGPHRLRVGQVGQRRCVQSWTSRRAPSRA